jgi:hypothetical protein
MTMYLNCRLFSLGAMALGLFVLDTPTFAANEAKEATHDGKLINISGDQLMMTNKDLREYSYTLTADAKLTLDGKVCKAADLIPGTRIRVTTRGEDNRVANRVEALDRNLEFSIICHDGKFVSVTGNKLNMTNMQGDHEHSCELNADVKVTCDGKVCKSTDLRPGMKIRVSSESDDPHKAITRIEALDKNPRFVSI